MSKPKEHDPRAERRPSRYEEPDAWFVEIAEERERLAESDVEALVEDEIARADPDAWDPPGCPGQPRRLPPPDFAKAWEPAPAGTVIARPRESAEGRGGLNDRNVPGWRRQRQA